MYSTNSLFRHANYDVNQTIFCQMMSDDQCEEIYVSALDLLQRVGSKVTSKKAQKALADNGCWVEGDIVYLPTAKVEEAIRTAPFRVSLFDRLGNPCVLMETCNSHIGPGFGAKKVLDKDALRDGTMDDVEKAAIVAEALRQVDFIAPPVVPGDKGATVKAFQVIAKNSTKPVIMPVATAAEAKSLCEMAAAAVGGEGKLARGPYMALAVCCNESLQHTDEAMDIVMLAAEKGVPVIYTGDFVCGKNAPFATAGTLVVALAADLLALVLSQSVKAGAPFVLGGKFSINDEKNDALPLGAPEVGLMNSGFANLARYLNLPCACQSGSTDSYLSDMQLGIEGAYGIVSASISGVNAIFGCGMMGRGEVFCLHSLALADEIAALIRRIMKNSEVDEEHIGRGVIGEVSPGGNYLGTDHTSQYFKTEQYWPNLQTRKRIDDWLEEGGKTMGVRATEYVDTLLAQDAGNPLTADQEKKMAAVVASY